MLPKRHPTQDKRPTQIESAGLAKIFQSHGEESKNQGRNTSIRQNRFLKKSQKERHRWSIHNTQEKNPPRRQKHCKYICTQHRSTQIHKENLGGFQERY